MREFVYFSRKARTSGNIKDLMKAGRLDIACHIVIHSFFVSHAIRKNVKLHLFFYGPPDPPKHIELYNKQDELKQIISKKDVSGLISRMLYKYKQDKRIQAFKNCFISKQSLISFIEEASQQGRAVYLLDEKGKDIRKVDIKQDPIFVLGDHQGLPSKEKKRLMRYAEVVSLGDITYFASQALIILQNELDRRGIF